ncbi:hypothetical protein BU14_0074s0069 [Porphyra umbilicalis]|uniref:Uncharacterized protein n=1 Tax=Porphyra umbilicalis TaxID=2786 RepID=A0A1X6PFL5_PORUM|nr:hypothetical protein BU14_0074s0069 [Porphyra umbilicalis]|eukprot:OSX79639.1 hypothetical protein BU14_0074s0069 [Porphyra umbilicalis]
MRSAGVPPIGDILTFVRDLLALVGRSHVFIASVLAIYTAHKQMTIVLGASPLATFFHSPDEELNQTEVYRFFAQILRTQFTSKAALLLYFQQFRLLSLSLRVVMMVAVCIAFLGALADEREVELFEALSHITILTASWCLMGRHCRCRFP